MDHLVPPMEPEPPPDYLDFVRGHLVLLRHEAARLVDSVDSADQVYPAALCDVARHWRWLRWQGRSGWLGRSRWLSRSRWSGRFGRPDAATDYLRRRLATRAKQWRDERIYPVDVQVTALAPAAAPAAAPAPVGTPYAPPLVSPYLRSSVMAPVAVDSVALRMAALLPGTVRAQAGPVAEAAIAWEHAYRQHCWWRLGRRLGATALLVVAVIGELARFSGP